MNTQDIDVMVISPLPPQMLAELEQIFRIHNYWLAVDKVDFLRKNSIYIKGVVTRSHLGIDAGMINALPELKVISIFGVGLDATDVKTAHQRGIVVTHTPRVLSECVADTALALMLNVSRRYCEADRFARSNNWTKVPFPASSRMHGKICGIAGMGHVGHAVATRAQAFGMPIHYFDPFTQDEHYTRYDSLIALAESCDFLVLTLPGGPETLHIVNHDVLTALGKTGILVNVARGSIVDTDALIEVLKGNAILGAGLDVFEDEPNIPPELTEFDNVVLLPHLASNTVETRQDMAELAVNNIKSFFDKGETLTPVR